MNVKTFSVAAILLLLPLSLWGQSLQVIQAFDVGKIVVVDNNSVGSLTIDHRGNFSKTSHFLWINLGHPGRIALTGYNVNQEIFISGSVIQSTSYSNKPSVEHFVMSDLSLPSSVVTDVNGSAVFGFGGTVQNSGQPNSRYVDTEYFIDIAITLSF